MANHAHVYTKKHLTREKVRAVLDNLNEKYLFGLMQIEETEWGNTETPLWILTFNDVGDPQYSYRQCWLESRQHFEIRHGGGPTFLWWIDSLVQDEIARTFNGQVEDDSIGERLDSWNTPFTFPEYINKHIEYVNKSLQELNWIEKISIYRWKLRNVSKEYMRQLRKMKKSVDKSDIKGIE